MAFRLPAILRALRFRGPEPEILAGLSEAQWHPLLAQADRARLTLPLGVRCRAWLPAGVQARIDRDLANNAERRRRMLATCLDLSSAFREHGVRFVFLKGLTHWPYFCDDPALRPQYDIDVFCPKPQLERARNAAARLGFAPVPGRSDGPVDHLPTMIQKATWRWRGDYYDPELPPLLELHFRFWDDGTEGIRVDAVERFWNRRVIRQAGESAFPALSLPDTLSYAGLHLVKHLLRGNLRPYHVYELAHFLERSAGDSAFWGEWADLAPASSRSVQAVAFRLAADWFACRLHSVAQDAVDRLPRPVGEWFQLFSLSPLTTLERPNKDELLLHLCLLQDDVNRRGIVKRRLFPHPAKPVLDPHIEADTLWCKVRRAAYRYGFLASRGWSHARGLLSLGRSYFRWWRLQGRTAGSPAAPGHQLSATVDTADR